MGHTKLVPVLCFVLFGATCVPPLTSLLFAANIHIFGLMVTTCRGCSRTYTYTSSSVLVMLLKGARCTPSKDEACGCDTFSWLTVFIVAAFFSLYNARCFKLYSSLFSWDSHALHTNLEHSLNFVLAYFHTWDFHSHEHGMVCSSCL